MLLNETTPELSSMHIGNMIEKEPSEIVNLEDRDPKNLSDHLQVSWEDIIGEPMTIRSPQYAWTFSNKCFESSRNCCYVCLSVLCAPIAAFCLGITFACLSFEHIWCINPCLRSWKISCAATRNFLKVFAHAIIVPIAGACGYFWSEIKIQTNHSTNREPDKREDVFFI